MIEKSFDVLVVGAGHAGIEAALAAQRLGLRTMLMTNNKARMGYMSCNPSIGGLGKGHIVKEIDVLGGAMGLVADESCIQFRRLNASRGPAVRGSRTQCDKDIYSRHAAEIVMTKEGLSVLEAEAHELIIEDGLCRGVVCIDGSRILSQTTVITTGTFMNAVMHFGLRRVEGGRVGDKATTGISDQLKAEGLKVVRLKTGTPARAFRSSINWAALEPQNGDEKFYPFSFRSSKQLRLPQIQCFITTTNAKTHEIIRRNLDKSPMFCGLIEGIGPRYCPSIEDKIHRFADKESHQSFLEPEGLTTDSIYIQGISTSLPEEVQYEFLQTMPGLENVKLIRPGYAVEYDAIEPTQLHVTLETKAIQNLFLAGQVNSTSGYEEAAGQGLVAGANAALKCLGRPPLLFSRSESYIGVLIDDLVLKGTKEPYRMMTSRAEHRLVLREDNCLERLAAKAKNCGLIDTQLHEKYCELLDARARFRAEVESKQLVPNSATQDLLRQKGSAVLLKPISAADLLRRSEIDSFALRDFGVSVPEDEDVWSPVEIDIKYSGYIKRQNQFIEQANKLELLKIPLELDFDSVAGLSREEVEKLNKMRPNNLGQAQRLSGVNPSAIQALLVFLKNLDFQNDKKRDGVVIKQ